MKNSQRVSSTVELQGVCRYFGDVKALDGLDLKIEPGELVALLGPSGCGKTTALRIVAGLEFSTAGTLLVNGIRYDDTPASQRDMGMVFQAYSLFPNLNVFENIEYGLRARKINGAERTKRTNNMLELVGLAQKAKSHPHQLSGGQQQRVALARALAIEPTVLLLDEPLSALDAQVRTQIRDEIRRIQLDLGITTLFVTHDQEEAMSIADRVGVMSHGRLEQIDTPMALYNSPASAFVAGFVGVMNRIQTELRDGQVNIFGKNIPVAKNEERAGQVIALVRPEAIAVKKTTSQGNAKILTRSFMGSTSQIICQTSTGEIVQSLISSSGINELHPGDSVDLEVTVSEILVAHA